ncbi:N-acetylmuramoyl-L-alanine amidase [Phytoactinopolyspora limicola]|uniref:N-acetylmuramoyl-L-alanine amidase n=1 Tax=Phytoactinopolyspora limicola TaxID=2715536 RepID=UPI0014081BC2|nr:N-acetylmuramoyl-L-alanine amidase [Phytoactinopolyspora limicola]
MDRKPTRRTILAASAALLAGPVLPGMAHAGSSPTTSARSLGPAFGDAADGHDVPRDLLVAMSQALSHGQDRSSADGRRGVMQLADGAAGLLTRAAELAGHPPDDVRTTQRANIDAAAALLRSFAADAGLGPRERSQPESWYEPVVRYTAIPDVMVARWQADAVYAALTRGVPELKSGGEPAATPRHPVAPVVTTAAPMPEPRRSDYPQARWVAAHSSNYRTADRPREHAIDRVVIHTAQGTYAGTISWFQNPSSNVSAHYVVRSSDGQVTQMVRHKDVGWHVGSSNSRSIGIEHEGWVDDRSWYTEAMYRSSAALTRFICEQHGIPLNRTHIVGHNEIPGATHTDPGRHWDWDRYMSYVQGDSGRWRTVVDNEHSGFAASSRWVRATASGYEGTHHHARPVQESDVAWFKARIPSTGSYRVEVWYPEHPTNNSRAPHLVNTTRGYEVTYLDQRAGGGRWTDLGVYQLASGTRPVLGVSRWTGTDGWIEADAVRISST